MTNRRAGSARNEELTAHQRSCLRHAVAEARRLVRGEPSIARRSSPTGSAIVPTVLDSGRHAVSIEGSVLAVLPLPGELGVPIRDPMLADPQEAARLLAQGLQLVLRKRAKQATACAAAAVAPAGS